MSNENDKIRDLERLVPDLQMKVATLESTTISTILSDITELKEHTGGLTEIVTALKSDMKTHFASFQSNLQSIQVNMALQLKEISTLLMSYTNKTPEKIARKRINSSPNDDSFDDNDDDDRGKRLFHLSRLPV